MHLLHEHQRRVDIQATAAVLRGRHWIEPALLGKVAPQLPSHAVRLVGLVVLTRTAQLRRHVVLEPLTHLGAEVLLLIGVVNLEVHVVPCTAIAAAPVRNSYRAEARQSNYDNESVSPGPRRYSRATTPSACRRR